MTIQKQFKYLLANRQDVKVANAFFKQQSFKGRARKGEWLSQIYLDNQLIALLRVTPIEEALLLRNLCVHQQHRNAGVGSDLLAQTCGRNQQDIYTFPLSHLSAWYQRNGATLIEPTQLPSSLLPYYESYCRGKTALRCAVFETSIPH